MIDVEFCKRHANLATCTARTMVKSGDDFVLTETYEYIISKQKMDNLKEETTRFETEVTNQKKTFTELDKEGPIDLT